MSRKHEKLEGEELKLRFIEAKARLAEHLRQLGKELESEFSETVDKASIRLEHSVDHVAAAVTATANDVGESVNQTVARLKEQTNVRHAVGRKPLQSVGLSVAAGFGLAMLMGRRPRLVAPSVPAPHLSKSAEKGLLAALVLPALAAFARRGAGQMLEAFVEHSVRQVSAGLEARSPHYHAAAERVRDSVSRAGLH